MRIVAAMFLLLGAACGQVLQLGELNTRQIAALDRQKTVIIIPGGILEEHGPYLPSYTDGFLTARLSRDIAEAIITRPGWTAVITPEIPLGHGGANIIGRKYVFPGSYTVRVDTLREVYMDMADAFGQQGFRWIFVLHDHGAPNHHRAINDAGDYFHDTYGGQMVHLFGINEVYFASGNPELISPAQLKANGLPVHADLFEQSQIMFLRPDLVSANVTSAPTLAGAEMSDLVRLAQAPDWPGYFGLVKDANASIGARDYKNILTKASEITNKILNGTDPRTFPRYYDEMEKDPATNSIDKDDLANDAMLAKKHSEWHTRHAGGK
jgi:creatinine amidohydrolase/Fe(II)-dependent formamide hydrolase-like protein